MSIWGYSVDGESYQCPYESREEAIAEAKECCEGDFFVAQGVQPLPSTFMPDADEILESMGERAADSESGEWAEDWPPVPSKEAKQELETFLKTWADKHCPVTWYIFGNFGVEEIEHTKS